MVRRHVRAARGQALAGSLRRPCSRWRLHIRRERRRHPHGSDGYGQAATVTAKAGARRAKRLLERDPSDPLDVDAQEEIAEEIARCAASAAKDKLCVCRDPDQPTTVELGLRKYKDYIERRLGNTKGLYGVAGYMKDFVRSVVKILLEESCRDYIGVFVKHFEDIALLQEDLVLPLGKSIIQLAKIDLANVGNIDVAFLSMKHAAVLYKSKLYKDLLQKRFAKQLESIKGDTELANEQRPTKILELIDGAVADADKNSLVFASTWVVEVKNGSKLQYLLGGVGSSVFLKEWGDTNPSGKLEVFASATASFKDITSSGYYDLIMYILPHTEAHASLPHPSVRGLVKLHTTLLQTLEPEDAQWCSAQSSTSL